MTLVIIGNNPVKNALRSVVGITSSSHDFVAIFFMILSTSVSNNGLKAGNKVVYLHQMVDTLVFDQAHSLLSGFLI